MSEHGLTVVADRARCFGAEACTVAAPDTFSMDAEHRVQVGDPSATDAETLRFAVQGCPAQALRLVEGSAQRSSPPKTT